MPKKSPLFSEFPSIDRAEWMAKIEKDLKGKAIETLDWEPEPGWKLPPLLHPTDGQSAFVPSDQRSANHWAIGQMIVVEDLKEANQQVLNSLQGGVNALVFQLDAPLTKEQLDVLLKDVIPSYIKLHFSWTVADFPVLKFWEALQAYFKKHGGSDGNWQGSLQWSPNPTTEGLIAATKLMPAQGQSAIQLFYISDQSASSSNIAVGLADLIRQGQAYIAQLQEMGIEAQTSAPSIQFAVSINNAFFVEIARIRALKILWSNVLKAYGLESPPIHITAYTAAPNAGDDPYRFMIQSATQAMSAVIGGANSLFVRSADHGGSTSDSRFTDNPDFGPRIARNVQHLLQLESFMDRVIDPGAGSYYIEHVTQELAAKAWRLFQEQAI